MDNNHPKGELWIKIANRTAILLLIFTVGFWCGYVCGPTSKPRRKTRQTSPAAATGAVALDSKSLAVLEGVSTRTITQWATEGKISGAYKRGREWRFPIDYKINERERPAPSAAGDHLPVDRVATDDPNGAGDI